MEVTRGDRGLVSRRGASGMEVVPGRPGRLLLTLTANKTAVRRGEPLGYTLVATNGGDTDIVEFEVHIHLPPELVFPKLYCSDNTHLETIGEDLLSWCLRGAMPPGARGKLLIYCKTR